MKRMHAVVLFAVVTGVAVSIAGGFIWWKWNASVLYSLEEALWIIDPNGNLQSPTSSYTRAVLADLSTHELDIHEKGWESEVIMNQSAELDMMKAISDAKKSRQR